MPEWYKVMFPDAESTDDLVPLYSFHTVLGTWEVHTPVRTFRIQPLKGASDFFLFWNDDEESTATTASVYDAIISVAQHATGVEEWDRSSFEAPDYLKMWKREVPKRAIYNFIDQWMERNPEGDLRQIVDYFEHEDTHLIDRMNIIEFMKDMIVTRQMYRFPRVWMPPAEMLPVVELARQWGLSVRDDRPQPGNHDGRQLS